MSGTASARMGRPFALDPEIEGAIFGVLSLFVRKTPEYRAKRKEMAALHGLTERTIDNIVERQYARLLAMNGKGPRSSKQGAAPSSEAEPISADTTDCSTDSTTKKPNGGK